MSDLSSVPRMPKHRVVIKYCVPCDYSESALMAAQELIRNYQHVLDELTFEMSRGGVFEITVDGATLFSKRALKRHPKPGEIFELFQHFVGKELPLYPRG